MKMLTIFSSIVLSALVLFAAGNSENLLKSKSRITVYDTLPAADSASNRIDTFGGLKNINDSNLKAKKDSLFK